MQNSIKNLDNALLFLSILENSLFCLKIWKFDELQLSYSSVVLAETSHTLSTYHCLKKRVWKIQNLQQKNSILLIMNQKVIIHTIIQ